MIVRGYAPLGKVHKCAHYVKLAAQAVDFYVEYFGLPYPLPKLDLVAVHQLSVRAMENWGCITFDKNVLLCSPEECCALNV